MKSIILTVILSVICALSYAQDQDIEYMEVRFIAYQGLQYRLSPMSPFKKAGFFSRNLTPYFKEDKAAYKALKQHQLNMGLMYGSALIFSVSTSAVIVGANYNDNAWLITGGIGTAAGIFCMYYFNHKYMKRLQEAIDFYNISKNPSLSQFQPFIPTLQSSSQSLGISLVWDINP